MALAEIGRSEDARECFHRLTRISPMDVNAWIELAGVAHELGDFRRVGGAAKKIMALAPDRYEGYLFHGLTERHYGRLGRAVTLLRHGAEMAPDELMPNLMLGIALEESGDTRGAVSAYANAARIAPNSVEVRHLLESIELD
jgi:Flp pilus assembly protein TadD